MKYLSLLPLVGVMGLALQACHSDEVELTILHTNDIHLHHRAAKLNPFGLGGVARLATLLKQRRESAEASVTLDAGDWSEGTWYYNLDTGSSALRLMDMLKYDAVVLGNHDFLSGPARVIQTIAASEASFPVLAVNLDPGKYKDPEEFTQNVPGTYIKTINPGTDSELKIGFIGLTTFEFVYDAYMAPVKILNPIDTATRAALALRPKVDALIVISHNTFEVNKQVARSVPGIDAVISGHSHKKVPVAELVKNSGRDIPVVETGEWSTFLGELKLTVDKATQRVRMKSYQLIPVAPEVEEDPIIAAWVEDQDAQLSARYGDVHQKIAESDFDLQNPKVPIESPLGNLTVRAYRDLTGADLALEQTSFMGVGMAKGDLTLMDLHDVMPHIYHAETGKEWTVHLWNARGSDIALVMTVFYSISALTPVSSPLGWLLVDNALVTWDPAGKFNSMFLSGARAPKIPITSIQIGGKALDPSARYRVALNEGLLSAIKQANSLIHLGLDLSQVRNTGVEGWDAIARYAKKVGKLSLDELRTGQRIIAQGPDLAIQNDGFEWNGESLVVEVKNLGLTASPEGSVRCQSGLHDDLIAHGTELQKWSKIGDAKIPELMPNGSDANRIQLSIPWPKAERSDGYWPVECVATTPNDPYLPNNTVERVFRLQAKK